MPALRAARSSIGTAVSMVEVKIVDVHGVEVPRGSRGNCGAWPERHAGLLEPPGSDRAGHSQRMDAYRRRRLYGRRGFRLPGGSSEGHDRERRRERLLRRGRERRCQPPRCGAMRLIGVPTEMGREMRTRWWSRSRAIASRSKRSRCIAANSSRVTSVRAASRSWTPCRYPAWARCSRPNCASPIGKSNDHGLQGTGASAAVHDIICRGH